jgi:hypothetical protein
MASIVRRITNAIGLTSDAPPVVPADAVQDLIRQRPFGGSAYPTADGNYSGETPENRTRYREMMRCPWVKVGVCSKLWDAASDTLGMDPEDAENERDKMIAEAAAANVNNVRGGKLALIEALIYGPVIDGYGASHKKWWDCDRGKWGPKNGRPGLRMLKELRPKDSDFYDVIYDDFRTPVALREKFPAENDPNKGYLKLDDFVFVRHMSIFDSPFGMSDLRQADQAFCCLDAVRKLRMIYLDKYSGPFIEGVYSESTIKESLLAELRAMRAGGVIVYPKGTETKITQAASGADDAYHQCEADLKEEIVVSVTFAFLQHIGGQVPGGAGRTSEHAQTAKLPKWYIAQLVLAAIDEQITPQFVEFNFSGNPAFPKAKLEGTDPEAIRADLEIAAMKLDMGGELSKSELDKRSGWGPAKDDADRLVKTDVLNPFAALTDPTPVGGGTNPPVPAKPVKALERNGVPVKPGANGAAE